MGCAQNKIAGAKDRGKTCHSYKLHLVLFCLLLSKQLNNGCFCLKAVKLKHFSFNHSAATSVVIPGVCKFQRVSAASHPPAWGAIFRAGIDKSGIHCCYWDEQADQNCYRLSQIKHLQWVQYLEKYKVTHSWLKGTKWGIINCADSQSLQHLHPRGTSTDAQWGQARLMAEEALLGSSCFSLSCSLRWCCLWPSQLVGSEALCLGCETQELAESPNWTAHPRPPLRVSVPYI